MEEAATAAEVTEEVEVTEDGKIICSLIINICKLF